MNAYRIIYQRHAVERMAQRGIREEDVEYVLRAGEKAMKCIMCKQGETQPGTTTMTLERDATTIVFKNAPAEVCQACCEA